MHTLLIAFASPVKFLAGAATRLPVESFITTGRKQDIRPLHLILPGQFVKIMLTVVRPGTHSSSNSGLNYSLAQPL